MPDPHPRTTPGIRIMNFPGSILMGAQSQLLDPTIPYRYFAAALFFHILLWALIAAFPGDIASFAGGPGPALAALHSLTLGVLAMTAMGVSFQMLPVATGISLHCTTAPRAASWFFIPGTVGLVWGMAVGEHMAMAVGGLGVALGLAIYMVLVAGLLWRILRRAVTFEPLSGFGLAALAALAAALALGPVLIIDGGHGFLHDRAGIIALHFVAAGFGFMGMLALGFSHILVPLFALSEGVPVGETRTVFALALFALVVALAGIFLGIPLLTAAGALAGLLGLAVHFRGMRRCLATGMRRKLGISVLLMRAGWFFLALSLMLGLATALDLAGAQGFALFVFAALFGWLLTFLLGVLQRVLPFLGAMNATSAGATPPLMSELAPEGPRRAHALCHVLALLLVAAGIALEAPLPVRLGGLAGLLGALIYTAFALRVLWLIRGCLLAAKKTTDKAGEISEISQTTETNG